MNHLLFLFLVCSKQAWAAPIARSLHGTGVALQPVNIVGQPANIVGETTMTKVSFFFCASYIRIQQTHAIMQQQQSSGGGGVFSGCAGGVW